MRYIRFGAEGAQPLVILPGLSIKSVLESADLIVDAYQLPAKDHEIFLFDRRSDLPPVYSIYDMAEDTATAMSALGLKDVLLFGVSQGGMMAQVIAVEHPELVKALVLGSTASRFHAGQEANFRRWLSLAEAGEAGALSEAFAEAVYSKPFYEQYKDLILASVKGASREDLARFSVLAGGTSGFDIYDRLDRIQCPVLVLGAGKDQVLGIKSSEEIAQKLGCAYYNYEEYGHAVYDEAPDYQARILAFFDSI